MVKIITGTEPYRIDEEKRKFKEGINLEYDFLQTSSAEEALEFVTCIGFFGERLCILNIKDLGELGSKNFENNNRLLIILEKLDKRKAKKFEVEELNKYTSNSYVAKVINQELKGITPAALELLIKRINYVNDDSVNLYTVINTVRDLCDFTDSVTEEDVLNVVSESVISDAFSVLKLIEKKDLLSIRKQNFDKPMSVLGAMMWQLKKDFKSDFSEKNLKRINIVNGIVNDIKSGKIAEKDALNLAAELLVIE